MAGKTIAHYQIVEKLGEGGMDVGLMLVKPPSGRNRSPKTSELFSQEGGAGNVLKPAMVFHQECTVGGERWSRRWARDRR